MNPSLIRSILALLLCGIFAAQAEVRLPSILGDNAVLARSAKTCVWGKATPGEEVRVSLGDVKAATQADTQGDWRVRLDLSSCGAGPFTLTVNDLTRKNILVGEIWLCAGQSNMAFRMSQDLHVQEERENSKQFAGQVRMYQVNCVSKPHPQWEAPGRWIIADAKQLGAFTGVGYYFAKELFAELRRPIGLVYSNWGGTRIESWMSRESMEAFPEGLKIGANVRKNFDEYPARLADYVSSLTAWVEATNRQDPPLRFPAADAEWKPLKAVNAPGNGVLWLRRHIHLTPAQTRGRIPLHFGYQNTPLKVFLDGKLIAEQTPEHATAQDGMIKSFPANTFTPGEHELLLRYWAPLDTINMRFTYTFGPHSYNQLVWDSYRELDFGKPSAGALAARPKAIPRRTEARFLFYDLYNAMIHPLLPMTLHGILWYQGESNAGRPDLYAKYFPALIQDWRKRFGDPSLPFYYCQLPAYMPRVSEPDTQRPPQTWPPTRAAQDAALKLPRTGHAVLIDTGELNDIHPRDKRPAGHRLALLALADVYGKQIHARSPMATRAQREGHRVRVSFDHIGDGLMLRPVPAKLLLDSTAKLTQPTLRHSPHCAIEDVALQGADGQWHWATEAVLEGNQLVAAAEGVPSPVAIRYCYLNFPVPTIFSQNGLPAAAFELKVQE